MKKQIEMKMGNGLGFFYPFAEFSNFIIPVSLPLIPKIPLIP